MFVLGAQAGVTNFTINVRPLQECNDGLDNDSDTYIDYPDDPECASLTDNIEANKQCNDNYDNDSDTYIDYPDDSGCDSADDSDESDVYQCNDGLDNDNDGKTDYPDDPGCNSLNDNNEQDQGPGGRGRGSGLTITPVTSILFIGKAYPLATITVLQDGQQAVVSAADSQGDFRVGLVDLTPGHYSFSLLGSNNEGNQTNSYSFRVKLYEGAITEVSDIFLSPTITIDKTEVVSGEKVIFFGLTAPNGEVTIDVNPSTDKIFLRTTAGASGVWVYNFDTNDLKFGKYKAIASAVLGPLVSDNSRLVEFMVVKEKAKPVKPGLCRKSDLNCDGRVNLVDFSIAAYWHKRPFTRAFRLREIDILNGDGKIDLVDFSILAYYWTG